MPKADAPASLNGLRVWITRPEGRAADLIAAIESAGGEARHEPVMRIAPYSETFKPEAFARAQQRLVDIQQYDRLIFISVNAVSALARFLPERQLPNCWAIGRATETAIQREGWPVAPSESAMNSEALLSSPEWRQVAGQRIAIIKGEGGRGLLAQTLVERGAEITEIPLYERESIRLPESRLRQLLTEFTVNCVCVNSSETLAFLQQQWNPSYVDRPPALVVPSQRVASTVNNEWFGPVVVSANAGLDATLEALRAIRQTI